MTNVGDHVKCPQCGVEARVVWVSQEKKVVAVKCMRSHSHISSSTKTKEKTVKEIVFLIEPKPI